MTAIASKLGRHGRERQVLIGARVRGRRQGGARGWLLGGDQALRGARGRDLRGAEHLPARDRRRVGDSVRGAISGAELRRVHAACQNAVGARTGFPWAADTGDCAIDRHAVAGWGSASDTGAREVMKQRRSTSALEVAVVATALPATRTLVAGRRRTESHPFTKRANMCADHARTLDACGVATPYRRRWHEWGVIGRAPVAMLGVGRGG